MTGLSDIQFVFALLIVFQVKQFLGDYVFQTAWMVQGKSKAGPEFLYPLSIHVLVHAAMTFLILMVVNKDLWYLVGLDFVVHFIMDRIKSGPKLLGRFTDTTKSSFWIPLGFDQMVHHFTHYAIIWILLTHRV